MIKKYYIHIIAVITVITILLIPLTSLGDNKISMTLYADKAEATIDEVTYPLKGTPVIIEGKTYIPAEDILTLCGFTLGWDDSSHSAVAVRGKHTNHIVFGTEEGVLWADDKRISLSTPPVIYRGITYISLEMFANMSEDSIYIVGTLRDVRDLLTNTVITDEYRLTGKGTTYKGVTVVGNTGMELLTISDSSAKAYADMVNSVAAALPDVNVYNIAVPTASEFYAPKSLYTNQTAGIKKIYENLSPQVTPVNVVKPLMEHAAEFIYFRTDHHWTQKGAYYAYKEFADIKGETIDPLESFEVHNSYSHVGSFASFMSGTYGASIMRSNPDMLQVFMPKYTAEGAAYKDMYMKSKKWDLQLVYPNFNSYSAFIGGDNPLAVFHTSNANGKKLVIIKESFGTAFATWAVNNYEYIYVIDPRQFNGFGGHTAGFNLKTFYQLNKFDDLVIINYPGSIGSASYRSSVMGMIR